MVIGCDDLWPEGTSLAVVKDFSDLLPAERAGEGVEVTSQEIERRMHSSMADVKWKDMPKATFLQTNPRSEAIKKLAGTKGAAVGWLGTSGKGEVFWYPVAGNVAAQPQLLHWLSKGRVLTNSLRWGAREKFSEGSSAKRNLWLVCLSLLVCIVGITNAMLMSVTERFREIGTMKCLGALDSFIVRLFLIESSFQGAAGSIIGAVLGLLLALVRNLFAYHVTDANTGESYWLTLHYFPVGRVLLWMAIAVIVGVVLSVIAAIYPAYRAAKMEPVEAMRSEA
jgi:hypothetical protein